MRTGGENHPDRVKVSAAMEFLLFLVFLLALAVAATVGLGVDTRDSADWKPTADGRRWRSGTC